MRHARDDAPASASKNTGSVDAVKSAARHGPPSAKMSTTGARSAARVLEWRGSLACASR